MDGAVPRQKPQVFVGVLQSKTPKLKNRHGWRFFSKLLDALPIV
jgi:hypothetical protein